MKKYILSIIALGLIVGCGNSHKSSPPKENRVKVDVVNFVPSKNMEKHFSYGMTFVYGGIGRRLVEILPNNNIKITQYASSISHTILGEVIQDKSIVYNDTNITGFYDDTSGQFSNITYTTPRYIYKNDVVTTSYKEYTFNHYNPDVGMDIGTEQHELRHECLFKDIVNIVHDSSGNIQKKGGEYLLLECTEENTITYHIALEHRNISDLDGTSTRTKMKRFKYYEKNIGYLSEYTDDKANPYNYFVDKIEYLNEN